jgi:hypothetical protein
VSPKISYTPGGSNRVPFARVNWNDLVLAATLTCTRILRLVVGGRTGTGQRLRRRSGVGVHTGITEARPLKLHPHDRAHLGAIHHDCGAGRI